MADNNTPHSSPRSKVGYLISLFCALLVVFGILKFTSAGRGGFDIGEYGDGSKRIAYCKREINDLRNSFKYYRTDHGKYPENIRNLSPDYIYINEILKNGETRPIDLEENYEEMQIKYHFISDSEYTLVCNQNPKCEIRYSSMDKDIEETGDCTEKNIGNNNEY